MLFNNHVFPIENEKLFYREVFKSREKTWVCKDCFSNHSSEDNLKIHQEYCEKDFKTKDEVPEGGVIKFKNYQAQMKMPYVCYIDSEAKLEPVNIQNKKTNRYQKHKLISFGCLFVNRITGEKEYNEFKNPKDLIDKLCEYSKLLSQEIPLKGDELKKANEALKNEKVCNLCKKEFKEDEKRVQDHDHFTGKFRGILHNSCNLNLKKPKFIPVFGHYLMKYDEKLLIRSLKKKTNIIAKNIENFIAFDLKFGQIKFIDSFKFLNSSLEKLITSLLKEGKEKLKITKEFFPEEEKFNLCLRKGVFPYDYISSFEKLKEENLPPKKEFYSKLYEEKITDEDYEHAKKVWNIFKCKTFKDYYDIYLKLDCCLLADIFEEFRERIYSVYQLDPAHYLTLPSLAMDSALKFTGQELELITDLTIYHFLEQGIRGGISMVVKRYAKANNPYLGKNFDPSKISSYLMYLDAVNLYGKAMCFPLPIGNFRFSKSSFEDLQTEWENEDCIVDCDVYLPEELKDKFKDYPLFPHKYNERLCCTFFPQKKYICHSRYLKIAISKGYVLKRINRILHFDSKPWLKPFVEKNTEMRMKAKSKFEENLWKLMNNSTYGKQMENVRNRVDIVHATGKYIGKEIAKQNYKAGTYLGDDVYLAEMAKTKTLLNKPLYGGLAILDFSKIVMIEFFYDFLKPLYGDNLNLLYTDTDSFFVEIFTEDFFKDISPHVDKWFDTFDYHPFKTLDGKDFPVGKNKKVMGTFSDELDNDMLEEFYGLRSKLYMYTTRDGKTEKRSKGATKLAMKKIQKEHFQKALEGEKFYGKMNIIHSHNHEMFTETIYKKVLDGDDSKRKKLEDRIHTLPHGY